jgi:hypothetical protein
MRFWRWHDPREESWNMKTRTPLLFLLGLGAVLAGEGCVSTSTPQPGYLVYYDPADAGAIWRWDDGIGWSYLGERRIRLNHDHVPGPTHAPRPGHEPPPGIGHHRPPERPGKPPKDGTPCYFFFGRNGSVLASRDGAAFRGIGHFATDGGFVHGNNPAEAGTLFRGTFNGAVSSFHVDAKPVGELRGWAGSVMGSGGGPSGGSGFAHGATGSFGGANYSGGAAHSGNRTSGSFHGGNEGGSGGGSGHSGGWSGGGGSGSNRSSSGGGGGGGGRGGDGSGGNDHHH